MNGVTYKYLVMTKPLHLLLLLFFALLQSVAPLVHAHVDGNQTGLSASVSKASLALLGERDASRYFLEGNESPAICMADQLQRNDSIGFMPPAVVLQVPTLPVVAVVIIFPPVATLVAAASPYQKPHPQAPPIFC
ncbi:MAG: hypothetical protein WCI39_02145 [Gallionellaceae bacterium]